MSWFSRKTTKWERGPGELARRIEAADVARDWGTRPFLVFEGTRALVFSQGKMVGEVTSGLHDIDGTIRRWIHSDDPTTLVIVDDGEIAIDLVIDNLYSQEDIPLQIEVRLVLGLDSPEAFYRNVMKDRRQYDNAELANYIRPEVHDAVLGMTSTRAIDDLYHNDTLNRQVAAHLEESLGDRLATLGFALVAIDVVRVESSRFDEVRRNRADVNVEGRQADLQEARLEVLKRVRERFAEGEQHEAVTRSDLDDAMRQAVHELGVKDSLREDELARLHARLQEDALDYEQQRTNLRDDAQVEHGLASDAEQRLHKREQETLDLAAFLDQKIQHATAREGERDLDREGDRKDWDLARSMRDDSLEARRRLKMQDVEVQREQIDALQGTDTATKIALGLGDTEALLELERLEKQQGLTPDQLLVVAAEKSDAVAAALAERFKAEGKLNEEVIEQVRRQIEQERATNREHASQLERVMKEALNQMGSVASAKAKSQGPGDQTIVTPGMGGAAVIDPRRPDDSDDS